VLADDAVRARRDTSTRKADTYLLGADTRTPSPAGDTHR